MEPIAIVFIILIGWLGGSEYKETQQKADCDNFKAVEMHKTVYRCVKK